MDNLIKKQFGKLLVLRQSLIRKNHIFYKCLCDCGKITIVRKDHLLIGNTKSCGCILINQMTKHGMFNTKFYIIWQRLKQRCDYKKDIGYKNYGGRGIIYDPRWNNFKNFYNDMWFKWVYAKKKYGEKAWLTIERENNNKNYFFENCMFIPKNLQAHNTRNLIWFKAVDPNGKEYKSNNQTQFALQYNLNRDEISKCLRNKRRSYKNWKFFKIGDNSGKM